MAKCEEGKGAVGAIDEDATEESDSLPDVTGAVTGGPFKRQRASGEGARRARRPGGGDMGVCGWDEAWGPLGIVGWVPTHGRPTGALPLFLCRLRLLAPRRVDLGFGLPVTWNASRDDAGPLHASVVEQRAAI